MICDPKHPAIVAMLERRDADEAVCRSLLAARTREAATLEAVRAAANRTDQLTCRAAGRLNLGDNR